MTRETYMPYEDEPREPDIESAIRDLVDQAQAPPQFATRVRAQLAQRQRRSWSFRLWVPVLATGLLLSLALNVWQVMSTTPGVHGQAPPSQALPADRSDSRNVETVADLLQPLAESYLKAGNYARLRDVADLVLMLNPDVPQAYRYRGMARAELGDEQQAYQDLRYAGDLGDPEARPAWMAHSVQRFQIHER